MPNIDLLDTNLEAWKIGLRKGVSDRRERAFVGKRSDDCREVRCDVDRVMRYGYLLAGTNIPQPTKVNCDIGCDNLPLAKASEMDIPFRSASQGSAGTA